MEPEETPLHTHQPGKRSERGGFKWYPCADPKCSEWRRAGDEFDWIDTPRPKKLEKKAEHEAPILAESDERARHPISVVVSLYDKLDARDKEIAFDIIRDL